MSKNGKSNITVAVRVRPLLDKEKRSHQKDLVRVEDNLIVSNHSINFYRLYLTLSQHPV